MKPALAARVVWFDALVSNPDRTHRNPNLLIWHREPWLIDHGAALYVHHDWPSVDENRTRAIFPLIRNHVLLSVSGDLDEADQELTARLTPEVVARTVDAVPDELLKDGSITADFASPSAARRRYLEYLTTRLRSPRMFLSEAIEARARADRTPSVRIKARR